MALIQILRMPDAAVNSSRMKTRREKQAIIITADVATSSTSTIVTIIIHHSIIIVFGAPSEGSADIRGLGAGSARKRGMSKRRLN